MRQPRNVGGVCAEFRGWAWPIEGIKQQVMNKFLLLTLTTFAGQLVTSLVLTMYSNIFVLSLLVLGVIFAPLSSAQITFSRSWVPQGKRASSSAPDMIGDRAVEVAGHVDAQSFREALAEGRREARLAALAQVAANIAVR